MIRLFCLTATGCSFFAPSTSPPVAPAEPPAVSAPAAGAQPQGGTPRCGPDVVVFPTWQGEYPGPIVSVKSEVEVPSYKDPCGAEPSGTCRLPVGVAHPWASPALAERFATVRSVERHISGADQTLPEADPPTTLQAGAAVEIHGYLGEGFCSYEIAGKEVTAMCPGLGDARLEPVPSNLIPERPFFFATSCQAWVLADAALFERPEIDEGTLIEYGKVGP
jgi:hypothetical protein